jgi:hypothetical protein
MNSSDYHPACIHLINQLYTVTQMNCIHIIRPYFIDITHAIIAYSLNYVQRLAA